MTRPPEWLEVRALRFATALAQAVHDRKLEDQGEAVTYYYDASTVTDAIRGLGDGQMRQDRDPGDWRSLLQALLTTGYLPEVSFLRPHLAEFYHSAQSIEREAAGASRLSDALHTLRYSEHAEKWGVPTGPEELDRIMGDPDTFAEFLVEHGTALFVMLQLVGTGTERDRLARIFRQGRFSTDPSDRSTPFAPDAAVTERMLGVLNYWRPDEERRTSNVSDALALAELADKHSAGRHVRFYSETRSVRSAIITDADLAPLFRSEDYFIARVSFPCLAFGNASDEHQREVRYSLDDLEDLSTRIAETLQAQSERGLESVHEALGKIAADEKTLPELLHDFYDAQLVQTLLLFGDLPEEMEEAFPSFYRARRDEDLVRRTAANLNSRLGAIYDKLEHEIGELSRWHTSYSSLVRNADKRVLELGDFTLQHLWVELGLGRWGLHEVLSDTQTHQVSEGVRRLGLGAAARQSLCSTLALAAATRHPPRALGGPVPEGKRSAAWLDQTAYLVCLLWYLRDPVALAAAEKMLPDETDGNPLLLHRLRIVAFVARTKTALTSHREALVRLTADAQALVDCAPDDSHSLAYAHMGLAHAAYWVWVNTGHSPSGVGGDAAERSFAAGQDALRLFDQGSLGWAFAVNHLAYVGTRAGFHPDETEHYVEMLKTRIPPAFDHYRFKDSEALVYIMDAERALGAGGLSETRTRTLCSDLAEADRLIHIHPHFQDVEVLKHISLTHHFQRRLDCPDR